MNQASVSAAGGGGVGVVEADRSRQVDHEMARRHGRDVESSVTRLPRQAVDVVDESVQRRIRNSTHVLHILSLDAGDATEPPALIRIVAQTPIAYAPQAEP